MFLGHSQQSTDYQKAPILFLETGRPEIRLQKHEGWPELLPESLSPAGAVQQRQEPAISLQEHPEFLSLLVDERFRQEMKSEPARALARFGVHLGAEEVPQSVELPSPMAAGKILTPWVGLF